MSDDAATARSHSASDGVLVWASVATLFGVLSFAGRIFFPAEALFTIATFVGGLVPFFLAIAAVLFGRQRLPQLSHRVWAFPALIAAGAIAESIAIELLVWTGRASDEVGDGPPPQAPWAMLGLSVAAIILYGAAVAVAVAMIAPHIPRPLSHGIRATIAVATAIPGALAIFALSAIPQSLSLAAGVVVILILVERMRALDPAPPASVSQRALLFRLALVSAITVAISWAVAASIGFVNSGAPIATSAMGWGSAAAQLGAIPLLVAFGARRESSGRSRWPALVGAAGITVSVAVQFVFGGLDGVAVFVGIAIVGVSLGVWITASARPVLPSHPAGMSVVAVSLMMLAGAGWLTAVVVTGGIAIALVAGAVALANRPGTGPFDKLRDRSNRPGTGPFDKLRDRSNRPGTGPFDKLRDRSVRRRGGSIRQAQGPISPATSPASR